MAISTFSNPLPSLIDGLLQGHQLGLSIRNAQQQRQQQLTQQALDNQKLTAQQLMNQNLELQNRQSLQQNARPVNSGMVTQEAGADIPSDVPGMPATPGAPAYVRKADPSRLLKTSDGQQWELKTPEEQQQSALNSQMSGMDQLEAAKAKAQVNAQGVARKYQLLQENGGTPAPAGLENLGIPQGSMLTRAELQAAGEASAGLRKANTITTRPGENIYDTSPQAGAAPQPGARPQQGGVPMDAIATGPAAPPVGMNAGLPPNLQPKTSPLPGGPPAATPAGGASAPPLPNNPTANRMRLIASGGPANPTGDYAQFKGSFLRGYLQVKGIANPQPKDETAAYQAFLQEKKAKQQPEWSANETELAQRAAAGDQAAEAGLTRLAKFKKDSSAANQFNITVPGLGPGSQSQANPQLTGEDFMKTLPAGTAAQVRAIANGSATMPAFGSRGASALLRDAVYRYDPSYTEQRAQVRKAFTTGPDGKNIGALNTAAVHLDQFGDAATAMNNGSFVPGNQIFNRIKSTFGSAAPTNFESLKSAVSGEMASALKGNATDPEIANIRASLQSANSPAQLAGAIQTNLHVLGAKLNTYQERYNQQIPGDSVYSPVLPSAKAVFDKYGVNSGTPQQQQGGGGRGGVGGGSQGQSTYLRTANGPNGHQIGQKADGGWYDVTTGAKVQ